MHCECGIRLSDPHPAVSASKKICRWIDGELLPWLTSIGLAVLKHTLTPRMRACHVAIEAMKDNLDAVYDVTVAYEGTLTANGQRRPAPTMPGERGLKFLKLSIY